MTTMQVTKETAAQKLAAFLHHEMSLAQLVDWAESGLLDGEFAGQGPVHPRGSHLDRFPY